MKREALASLCAALAAATFAALQDGTWFHPISGTYDSTSGMYWLESKIAKDGGIAHFTNQSSGKGTLTLKSATTWGGIDFGAKSAFTIAGKDLTLTGQAEITTPSGSSPTIGAALTIPAGVTATKIGAGSLTFTNAIAVAGEGTFAVTAGKVVSKASQALFGSPALSFASGMLSWQPPATKGEALSVAAPAFTFGPDRVQLQVRRGAAASCEVTFASLAASPEGGFLELMVTNDVSRLGLDEKILVAGRASDAGYVDASVVTRGSGATGSPLTLLVYDAEKGFVAAPEAPFSAGQEADGNVAVIGENLTLTNDTAVSALRIENGATLTIASGVTLTVGDGVHPAAVVFRAKGLAKATTMTLNGPGSLAFKSGSAGFLYFDLSSTGSYASMWEAPGFAFSTNLVIKGDSGVTFAGAAHANNDYGSFKFLNATHVGWTGGTSVLGVRVQQSEGEKGLMKMPSPLRVLGDRGLGYGGSLRQNSTWQTFPQDVTLGGAGRADVDYSVHDGVFCWGSYPYVMFSGRMTLLNDVMFRHDNACSSAAHASVHALAGITGRGGIRLNANASIEISGPSDYTGTTEFNTTYGARYIVRGPNGTPGRGPVVNTVGKSMPIRFVNLLSLVASNDFTTIGPIEFQSSTNMTFLGKVSAAKATLCDCISVGCGAKGLAFGDCATYGDMAFTAGEDGGVLKVGAEGKDLTFGATLRDGPQGERLSLEKVTSDAVTLCGCSSNSGSVVVREGTLKLSNDIFTSPDISYWLDASDAATVETDAEGRVTKWKSVRGVEGVAFVPPAKAAYYKPTAPTRAAASIAGRDTINFSCKGITRLVATNATTGVALPKMTQRTVFIVTRPRTTGDDFKGVTSGSLGLYGQWGADVGQRWGVSGWNISGQIDKTGATFDGGHGLRIDGLHRPLAGEKWVSPYNYHQNETQILTLRHELDYEQPTQWGTYTPVAIFTPALGGYWDGSEPSTGHRGYNGEIAEVIAFRRLLSESEMQVVENYLGKKWGVALTHAPDAVVTEPVLGTNVTLEVRAGTTLDLNGVDTAVAALSGAGLVTNSSARAARLVVRGANAFRGVIGGKVTLVEQGEAGETGFAIRDGAALAVDGGTSRAATFADGLVTNGIVYWVDASRPETVILDAKGRVTNWVCRAGSVKSFVAKNSGPIGNLGVKYTAPERYDASVAAFGGKPGVYFGGSTGTTGSNQLVTASATTTRTVFIVCACDGQPAPQSAFWAVDNSELGLIINAWPSGKWALRQYTGTTYHRYGHLLHAIGSGGGLSDFTWRTNASDWLVDPSFVLAAQSDETADNFSRINNQTYLLGRAYHRGTKAWFGEVIGYNRVLSESEVAGVEQYLYNKWFGGGAAVAPASLAAGTAVSVVNGGSLDFGGEAASVSTLRAGGGTLSNYASLTVTEAIELDVDSERRVIPLDLTGEIVFGGEGRAIPVRLADGGVPAKKPADQPAVRVTQGSVTGDLVKDAVLKGWALNRLGTCWTFSRLGFVLLVR